MSNAIENNNERVLIERNNMFDINDLTHGDCNIARLKIDEAIDLEEIETIACLANEIWREYYIPIIGREQVDYMLARFQNVTAIRHQINSGYHYFLLSIGTEPVAYFALLPDTEQNGLHISKLYVRSNQRRKGFGSQIIAFIETYGHRHGLTQNHCAIDFYLRNKFINAGSLIQDIGNGFVMDDFKMVKNIT